MLYFKAYDFSPYLNFLFMFIGQAFAIIYFGQLAIYIRLALLISGNKYDCIKGFLWVIYESKKEYTGT